MGFLFCLSKTKLSAHNFTKNKKKHHKKGRPKIGMKNVYLSDRGLQIILHEVVFPEMAASEGWCWRE
jgi:hypothetical protein